jgi:hypothetical protein
MDKGSLDGAWTDFQAGGTVCALSHLVGPNVIASAASGGAGDGIQPGNSQHLVLLGVVVSHAAIAAVLGRQDLSTGERLVAFSLASFANREQLAFAGTTAAAARAGLGKSRYLEAREQLVRRGLVDVESRVGGRGKSGTVRLAFAASGPWWDGDVNAQLLEAVLGYSRARGPARLLLAALAALADRDGLVEGVCTEELRAASGLADSTYRRARAALLASGDVVLVEDGGGRGKTNRWQVPSPAELGLKPTRARVQRSTPPPGARPLVATVPALTVDTAGATNNGTATADQTPIREVAGRRLRRPAAAVKGPVLSGVSDVKGPVLSEVSGEKGPILSGVSGENPAKTPPETPPETRPPYVRAGSNALNPRTQSPPSPPVGGSPPDSIVIEQAQRTATGRKRTRAVRVDLAEVRRGLGLPTAEDRVAWERIRSTLREAVGDSTFLIWLEPLELIAVDRNGTLVIAAPTQTASWVRDRFGRLIAGCAERAGHQLRLAEEPERRALGRNTGHPGAVSAPGREINQTEVS